MIDQIRRTAGYLHLHSKSFTTRMYRMKHLHHMMVLAFRMTEWRRVALASHMAEWRRATQNGLDHPTS
jgi:hypothetical protein